MSEGVKRMIIWLIVTLLLLGTGLWLFCIFVPTFGEEELQSVDGRVLRVERVETFGSRGRHFLWYLDLDDGSRLLAMSGRIRTPSDKEMAATLETWVSRSVTVTFGESFVGEQYTFTVTAQPSDSVQPGEVLILRTLPSFNAEERGKRGALMMIPVVISVCFLFSYAFGPFYREVSQRRYRRLIAAKRLAREATLAERREKQRADQMAANERKRKKKK